MNIKSFCVMALVAAGAVFSISGCGGGGGDNREDSYVSLRKFAAGAVTIYSINTRSLEITPESKISDQNMPTIDLPAGTGEDGKSLQYQADGAVLCSGTMGVRGGQMYQVELLYQVSNDEVGCIKPSVIEPGTLDEPDMLNALGFATSDDNNGLYGTGSSSSDLKYERIEVENWGGVQINILLEFKTAKMTIYTSGTGFVVTYPDGSKAPYPGSMLVSAATFPYIVEKR